VAFGADIVSHIIPDVTDTYDLGASDKIWRNIYVNNITGIGNLQLGDAATDAASEIKAYGDLELKADSDNDNGYTIGVELFRTRFSNLGGIGLSINRNQYDSSMNLLANSIFETLQVGDVVHGFGNYGNYPNVTSATITQIRGWYDGSNNLLSAVDGNGQALPETLGNPPAGAVELKIYLNASISYSNSALLTILPAGQALVSNSNNKSIKFYEGTTSIGTLNASSFVIPGKATIGGFTIPNTIGSAGEVLLVPSSGSELEWGTASSSAMPHKIGGAEFTDSLFVGHSTTGTLSQAQKNLAVGIDALKDLTNGDSNVAVGYAAGANTTMGGNNVWVGSQAGEAVTKSIGITAIGSLAGRLVNDSGSSGVLLANNTFVGYRSGYGVSGQTTHLAINNTAVGGQTIEAMTTGHSNSILGSKAGEAISSGHTNTIIGFEAGKTLETGYGNIIIGEGCLDDISTSKQGVIAIGRGIGNNYVGNNHTRIGHISTTKAEVLALFKTAEYANGGGNKTISGSDSGSIYHLNSTVDGVFTLPNTVGVGAGMQIDFVLTALPATTEHKIICNFNGANKLVGSLTIIDTDSGDATTHVSAQVSDNYIAIKLNGSTTGIVGSKIRLTSIASQKWLVEGVILVTGTPGNPFSTS
jgi:hypothetical protein